VIKLHSVLSTMPL